MESDREHAISELAPAEATGAAPSRRAVLRTVPGATLTGSVLAWIR